MLCDEFRPAVKLLWRANAHKTTVSDMQSFADAVHGAEKFVFDDVAAQAAGNVSFQKSSSILKALPFARAPFGRTWIEVAGSHLESYRDARKGRRPSADKPPPHRVGYLIESDDPDLLSGQVVIAWQHKGRALPSVCPFGFVFDHRPGADLSDVYHQAALSDEAIMGAVAGDDRLSAFAKSAAERDASRALRRHYRMIPALHCEGFWTTKGAHRDPERLDSYADDVVGEMNLLAAFLLVLQCRNAVNVEKISLPKANLKRSKEAKTPLYSYGRVSIQLTPKRQAAAIATGESDASICQHLVRGHFKTRKTGVFFWSPHLRGDASLGFHAKHYRVEE